MIDLLLNHQQKAIDFFKDKPRGALFLPMGLGKTLISLAFRYVKSLGRTIIVTKNSIKGTYADQINYWGTRAGYQWKSYIITADNKKKPFPAVDFLIVNYDLVWMLRQRLIEWQPQLIIADESNAIKNHQAQRTLAMLDIAYGTLRGEAKLRCKKDSMQKIGPEIPYRLILTGTSITKGYEDLYTQFLFLDQKSMPEYISQFRACYCPMESHVLRGGARKGQVYWKMAGYTNITESSWNGIPSLMDRIKPYVFAAKKEDCLDLPDKTFTTEMLPMSTAQKTLYRKMQKEALIELADAKIKAPTIVARLMKMHQLSNGFVIDEFGAAQEIAGKNEKIEWLLDRLPDLVEQHKVIIFAQFRWSAARIRVLINEMKIPHSWLVQDMNVTERQEQINRFNSDANVRVFVLPLQLGSHGLNLQTADYVIYVNKSYAFGDYEQSQDRIHRIGQTKHCHYISLVTEGTVEEGIELNLAGKKNILDCSMEELKSIVKGECVA